MSHSKNPKSNQDNSQDSLDDPKYDDLKDKIKNKDKKRKRHHKEEDKTLGGFIEDDYSDYSDGDDHDPDYKNPPDWKEGLSQNQIKTLTPAYNNLIAEFNNRNITEVDIINSTLAPQDKVEAYELLRVINSELKFNGESESWLRLRSQLYNRLKHNNLTKSDLVCLDCLNLNTHLNIQEKILRSNLPQETKAVIYRKYLDMKDLPKDEESYNKSLEWINTALSLPTEYINLNSKYSDSLDLITKVYDNLNKDTYGQTAAKERILDILSSMWVNNKSTNKCIVLIGPPGVGKTAFARSFANGANLPFYQISFGGATDSNLLKGHGFTYIGSRPGELVNALIKMKVKNGVLFLDELDKIQDTSQGIEVANVLLHILDYEQNKEFKDNYLAEIPIDLSNLIIIISVNSVKNINKILLDRLQLIEFKPYVLDEKVNIAVDYTIPRILKDLKIDPNEISISRDVVRYTILKSKIQEDGVRQLNRNFRTIFERFNTLKQIYISKNKNKKIKLSYDIANFKLPFVLDSAKIDVLFSEFS